MTTLEQMGEKFTKYEIARILGARALQLAMDAPILLKIDKEKLEEINYDVLKLAELEFEGEILPITVKRPFPKKGEDKIKKISKKEAEEKSKEKEDISKVQEEKRKEAEDRKIEQKEKIEEAKIREEGEIMELARPEDEVEDSGEQREQAI